MSVPLASVGAITLFVEDLPRSAEFYRRVFAVDPTHEDDDAIAFTFENTVINLLRSPAAVELIEPVPVGAAGGGPRCQFTIWVDDTDAAIAQLNGLGVAMVNGPIDRPWGLRTATFADPDGNIWELAALSK